VPDTEGLVMTKILVVDNHGQFTHLEVRLLNEIGIETGVIDNSTLPENIDADGIVLSGGPDINHSGECRRYLSLDIPILGICLGMQLMAEFLGGEVGKGEFGGYADVEIEIIDKKDPIVGGLYPKVRVWASHEDEVKKIPEGFTITSTSHVCSIESMSDIKKNLYGVQWHPEVSHTEKGIDIFKNFRHICNS
jgi:GMP synthase (glutamine-hydrolysing)